MVTVSELIMSVALLCQTGVWVQQVGCQKYYVECLKRKTLEQCISDFPMPQVRRGGGPREPSGSGGHQGFVGPGE